jgi:hypothetical protein
MRTLILLALLGMFALEAYSYPWGTPLPEACENNPSEPKWPSMYSATVEWRANHRPYHRFFRLFWDEKNSRARVDTHVEYKGRHYKMEALYFGEKQKAYWVFYDHDQAKCYYKDVKVNITHPDLSDATYLGTSVVEWHSVYHWEKLLTRKNENIHFRLFDTQEDREIKKIGYYLPHEGHAGTMTFHEVDYGEHDNTLFKLPKLIANQCDEKMEQIDLLDINDPMGLFDQFAQA